MTKKKELTFLFIITLLGIFVRYVGRDIISGDMETAFLPWFKVMKDGGGLAALSKQIGDYGLLYQTIIALLTYIDINPLYLYKILSVFFDFLLAVSIAYFIYNCGLNTVFTGNDKEKSFCLTYAYVLLLPTVVMNSAFWGQCDSIYTFFLLWSVWLLYKEKFQLSFFALGCSLAFKLQPILMFPLFVYSYFSRKKFSIFNVFITACTFWLSGIVVYLQRQRAFDSVGIYSNQVVMFKRMWMNVPSIWAFISDDYNRFHLLAIGLTFIILGIVLLMVITGKKKINSFKQMMELAIFVEWTCIIFLPAMHERYTYVMDLLLLMLAIVDGKYIIHAFIAIVTSCMTYSAYLFTGKELSLGIIAVYLLFWLHYSYLIFSADPDDDQGLAEHEQHQTITDAV